MNVDTIYNCDCIDLMNEMKRGGGNGRLYNNRPAVSNLVQD